jgi:hypothetical protein
VGAEWIGVGEVVFFGAILGAELVEIVVGEKAAVAVLPGADVNASDGESVGRLGGAEEHFLRVWHERQWLVMSG